MTQLSRAMKRHNRVLSGLCTLPLNLVTRCFLFMLMLWRKKISIAQNTRLMSKSRMFQGYTIAQF